MCYLDIVALEYLGKPDEFFLELTGLLPKLGDESRLGVGVYLWFVLNFTGAASVIQSVQGFVVVALSGGDARDHGRARVSTQGILEDASQLGVTIRDEVSLLAFLTQGRDDVAKDQ